MSDVKIAQGRLSFVLRLRPEGGHYDSSPTLSRTALGHSLARRNHGSASSPVVADRRSSLGGDIHDRCGSHERGLRGTRNVS